ncbi:recombinase family protein [Belnapia sp. T18]|uniref:Recombinase family protein n=1 Tax=Belnapia arida TaxID=2804533 RepID=A0ABS1U3F5_9PROT|nr:recombinase family protein [Belnapia arida]MBL6079205.1 recombinase family protein [Belnapia arida]
MPGEAFTSWLAQLKPGDILVVVALDRLARSLSHLFEVVEGPQARDVHFRSLRDPIDTASPQGLFTLQVLGAAAQLERTLIRERTRSGMRAAAARGSRPGNLGLRAGDPAARRVTSKARRASYLARLVVGADAWLPAVQRLRADGRAWNDVVRYLNTRRATGAPPWTSERLVRAVHGSGGLAEPALLAPARPAPLPDQLLAVVASVLRSDPRATLQEIGAQLEAICEPTPRGGMTWQPGSVAHVVARARKVSPLPEAR